MTDLEATDLFATAWQHHLDEQVERSPAPMHEWRAGGRRSKAYPDKEDAGWWIDHGPGMVKAWGEWITRMEETGWQMWIAPGGVPAVELTLLVHFGQTPVKMGLDRVMVSPLGQLAVIDLKTGGREPESDLQLGFYACGMELAGLPRPSYGAYWMARKGELTQLVNLDHYTVAGITDELDQFNRALEAEVFLPKRGNHCNSCGVKFACAAMNGEQAHLFDPSHPKYEGAVASE